MSGLPKFLFPKPFTTDFTIHNLPYGVFRTRASQRPRIGCAIGDKILDLSYLAENKFLHPSLAQASLNSFMAQGKSVWQSTRASIKNMLSGTSSESLSKRGTDVLNAAIVSQSEADMLMPAEIGDYTDFYASKHHASNVGKIFRPNQEPLLPNWKHLPVGYHGRASSVVVSGTDITRPSGQLKRASGAVEFGPSEKLDFEVEIAAFIGGPENALGSPVDINSAADRIFGIVLMNDWSARDIQFWEYVPLGPFLSKNFGTTISPWIVPMEALEPFLLPLGQQVNPEPLPYLTCHSRGKNFLLDLDIKTKLNGSEISSTNAKYLYWSFPQMIAHHSVGGCNLRPGDLLGSGTISSPEKSGFGSLLELTWNGKEPLETSKGKRTFVEDGDAVEMTGSCQRGDVRIGFGSCSGRVVSRNH
jgi:fumarylacetoacetase